MAIVRPIVETFEEWSGESYEEYNGHSDWHAVYTIQLGELIEGGLFGFDHEIVDWSEAAYSQEQYDRVCAYFIERFRYREISMLPYKEWAQMLRRKLVYELMPKYRPLYERVAEGVSPFAEKDEYHKGRSIESSYPETLLSENADYITDGRDDEHETITEGNAADMLANFAEKWRGVDELLLDELESMFICMYTANVNATW